MDCVIENGCDCGIAFDGSGERCLAVDENGCLADGDVIIAVCAGYMQKNETLRNVSSVSGTYVIMENCKLEKVNVKAGKDTRALAFRNCTITDSGILPGDLKVEMKENNGSFSILEEVNRKGKIKK